MPENIIHHARFDDLAVYTAFLKDLRGKPLQQTTYFRHDNSIVVQIIDLATAEVVYPVKAN